MAKETVTVAVLASFFATKQMDRVVIVYSRAVSRLRIIFFFSPSFFFLFLSLLGNKYCACVRAISPDLFGNDMRLCIARSVEITRSSRSSFILPTSKDVCKNQSRELNNCLQCACMLQFVHRLSALLAIILPNGQIIERTLIATHVIVSCRAELGDASSISSFAPFSDARS